MYRACICLYVCMWGGRELSGCYMECGVPDILCVIRSTSSRVVNSWIPGGWGSSVLLQGPAWMGSVSIPPRCDI